MIELHGHRGARGLAPENTIAGFTRAIALGVDAIECDVCLTSDDVVVLSHDPALNSDITRDAAGLWLSEPGPLLRNLRYDALLSYDVGRIRPGSATARAFPEQVPHDGSRIPTLSQLVALDPKLRIDLELKTFPTRPDLSASPSQLAAAVADLVLADSARVTVMSFDWRGLRWLRHHHPTICLAWLTSIATMDRAELWWDGVRLEDHGGSVPRAIAAQGGSIWAPEYTSLTEATLDEAHRLALRVIPWTVNQPGDITRLITWGVDGIITDYPDRFLACRNPSLSRGEEIGIDGGPRHKGS